MGIRWRLAVLVLQLAVLVGATALLTGKPYSASSWFTAGLLAVVLNPQLLEPFFTRPADVLANAIFGGVLYLTSDRSAAPAGWNTILVVLTATGLISLAALVFGADREGLPFVRIGRAATMIARTISSRFTYSAIFFLGALSFAPVSDNRFWTLIAVWLLIVALGLPNWQALFGTLVGDTTLSVPQGLIGPSRLLVSAPATGTRVTIKSSRSDSDGLLVSRIARGSDVWGEILLSSPAMCEHLARAASLTIQTHAASKHHRAVGVVLDGSTDERLQFLATTVLEVGTVVSVRTETHAVLYQIRWAEVERAVVKGGAHDVVRAFAAQLGRFDEKTGTIVRYRWVPTPGAIVGLADDEAPKDEAGHAFILGHLIGTRVPVFLDTDVACEGHLAILGMTRMGKTTFAARLARELAATRRVTIVDITGEWISKRGFTAYAGPTDDDKVGVSVFEPKPGTVAADVAHDYFRDLANKAFGEYKKGQPLPRVLLIDEAHQFVPEPALIGFQGPGRDAAQKFGLLMMQVRKYGITVILISQRTAVVAKSALSQCETLLAFKSIDQTGLEFLEAVLGGDAKRALPSLRHAEALAFGPAVSSDSTVAITVVP